MNLSNIEVFNIEITEEGNFAYISYKQDDLMDLNDGYSFIRVPLNLRHFQLSVRGNKLVNQSVKGEESLTKNNS